MSNIYDRIPKLSSAWKHLKVTDNSARLLSMGHMFSYWSERDKEPFGEFGLCHFMIHNRLVILCIKVKSGKVCASYKNLSDFIVSTAYKLCMETPVSHLEEYLLKYFVFEDGIFIFLDVSCSSFYDFGDILLFNITNFWTFSTNEESPYVCCIGVFTDNITYVSHSLDVKKGCGQVNRTTRLRQPSRQQEFPERVDVGFTRFNYRQT